MKPLLLIALLLPFSTYAADYMLTIKDHQFHPAELAVPSGTKIKLQIENQDAAPEEFDSHPLNREKVISGHGTATIYIGPLSPGRYTYTGEFHEATAQGAIVAQ